MVEDTWGRILGSVLWPLRAHTCIHAGTCMHVHTLTHKYTQTHTEEEHACMHTLSLINTHMEEGHACVCTLSLINTHTHIHGRGADFHSVSGQCLWRKSHPYRCHWETFSILTQVHSVPRTTEKTLHAICPGRECILTHWLFSVLSCYPWHGPKTQDFLEQSQVLGQTNPLRALALFSPSCTLKASDEKRAMREWLGVAWACGRTGLGSRTLPVVGFVSVLLTDI